MWNLWRTTLLFEDTENSEKFCRQPQHDVKNSELPGGFSKVKYYSLRQKPEEKELHVFKLRFDDTYRRYTAAKNPKIEDDEQANLKVALLTC